MLVGFACLLLYGWYKLIKAQKLKMYQREMNISFGILMFTKELARVCGQVNEPMNLFAEKYKAGLYRGFDIF